MGWQRRRSTLASMALGALVAETSLGVPHEGAFQTLPKNCATCLGKFDALHLGHASLAQRAREDLQMEPGLTEPCMVSFSGMAEVFGWPARHPLVAPEHRQEVLKSIGATERVLPFVEVRNLSPKDFVDFLVDVLGASGAVCGENFRFGYKAAGDANMLKELGKNRGIPVIIAPLQCSGGTISSTRMREMLRDGKVKDAATILGRPHRVLWRHRAAAELLEPANQIPGDGLYQVSLLLKEGLTPHVATLRVADGRKMKSTWQAMFLSEIPSDIGTLTDVLFDEGYAAQSGD